MNNTTSRYLTAIVAIFMAATLVVGIGTLAATTTTNNAFAYPQKKKYNGNGNGNTDTHQKSKQDPSQSGFDSTAEQVAQNVICTHPSEGANYKLPKLSCEQCFMRILNRDQFAEFLARLATRTILADLCRELEKAPIREVTLRNNLEAIGVSVPTQNELIDCLLKAGIVFRTA